MDSSHFMHIPHLSDESLKLHKTLADVSFVVLEGSPTIRIGEEEVESKIYLGKLRFPM